jgi:hypothetical protein
MRSFCASLSLYFSSLCSHGVSILPLESEIKLKAAQRAQIATTGQHEGQRLSHRRRTARLKSRDTARALLRASANLVPAEKKKKNLTLWVVFS